jgi:hypothetical protein
MIREASVVSESHNSAKFDSVKEFHLADSGIFSDFLKPFCLRAAAAVSAVGVVISSLQERGGRRRGNRQRE